jgi:hypothetical protein
MPGRQSQTVGWATARWSAEAADEVGALGTGEAAGEDDPLELEQPLTTAASAAAMARALVNAIVLS